MIFVCTFRIVTSDGSSSRSTYLIHLERSQDGLDEHGAPDRPSGNSQEVLSEIEDVVPQSSFQVRFHLRQIEVRTGSSLDQFVGIVIEVQAEIEQTGRDRLAINRKMLLVQMPASRSNDESGESSIRAELVILFPLFEVHLPADGVVKVDLSTDHVLPGGSTRVFKVGHVRPDIRVQGVDDHFSVRRPRDLDATVHQAGRRRGPLPGIILSDVFRLG